MLSVRSVQLHLINEDIFRFIKFCTIIIRQCYHILTLNIAKFFGYWVRERERANDKKSVHPIFNRCHMPFMKFSPFRRHDLNSMKWNCFFSCCCCTAPCVRSWQSSRHSSYRSLFPNWIRGDFQHIIFMTHVRYAANNIIYIF